MEEEREEGTRVSGDARWGGGLWRRRRDGGGNKPCARLALARLRMARANAQTRAAAPPRAAHLRRCGTAPWRCRAPTAAAAAAAAAAICHHRLLVEGARGVLCRRARLSAHTRMGNLSTSTITRYTHSGRTPEGPAALRCTGARERAQKRPAAAVGA